MKKILVPFFLLCVLSAQATIHTVDKTPGAGAQFTDINPAITAAAAGDTILVHPSQLSYGSITVNKHVVLIGPGHYPTVSEFLPATVSTFVLYTGSNGSVIEGFYITGILEGSLFNVANNITIRNNYFMSSAAIAGNYGDSSGGDNWMIEGNVFIDPNICGGCALIDIRQSASGNDNWTIRNNYFQTAPNGNVPFRNFTSTTLFANNIVVYHSTQDLFSLSTNSVVANNIFYSTSPNLSVMNGCTNCAADYNLFYNPGNTLNDVAGTDNIMNEDPQFVLLAGGSANWNYANDYHLAPGSPAIGTGGDGVDMGIYAEDYNFRMEGHSNFVPRLTSVTPQYIVVPVDGTFTIQFGAAAAGQ